MIYVTNTSDYLIKHKSTHVGRIQPRPTLLPTQTRATANHRRYWRPRATSSHPGARVRAVAPPRLGALVLLPRLWGAARQRCTGGRRVSTP